ncbi:MAG: DUF1501 domain-containing protein [Gemmataceae bacterium]
MPPRLRGDAAGRPASFGRAKACIVLFMWGGPAHLDTWDPKPDAPAGYRGEFRNIASRVPALRVWSTCRSRPPGPTVSPSSAR